MHANKLAPVFDHGLFDAEWYQQTYLDVQMLGMCSAKHYRKYGHRLQRAPSAAVQKDPAMLAAIGLPAPRPHAALLAASKIAQTHGFECGINYAALHVAATRRYTIDPLRANAELHRGHETGWLNHVNRYLQHFGAAAVHLRQGSTFLDRLACETKLPPVTDGPLVSIIMPAWNAAQTIQPAVRSILNQSWQNLELLIVDDASTDDTWDKLQHLAGQDNRVRIFRNARNVGPYVSKNMALSYVAGEWITGHDADDWAHPQRIEQHMNHVLAARDEYPVSSTYMARIEPDGKFTSFSNVTSGLTNDGVSRQSAISTLFDRQFLENRLGHWDSVRFGADSEMLSRAACATGRKPAILQLFGMLCLSTEGSLTNHPEFGIVAGGGGLSRLRLEYRDVWSKMHKTQSMDACYLPFPLSASLYNSPASHFVDIDDVRHILAQHQAARA
ncbi:glycosyltransferase family 2 protein [Aureimonas fodinaquatilis]|uniref:Glycosyltransferase family 2 protein n=1 Tax=Aureimonas fodinaquatilis TaxID=2565783 RepID=A0A5B0DUX6_9HYPH|nr:glycosyltransferase family 2 protein [Aureimonas fodinaquatilis]KAA0970574.1 glycosyltransferase family 2 protein [Aureimonas fodinaquatilis]